MVAIQKGRSRLRYSVMTGSRGTRTGHNREDGQGLVEYAMILVLVAVAVIVVLALLGPAIGNMFSNVMSLI